MDRAVVAALLVVIAAGAVGGSYGLYWLLERALDGWATVKRRLIRR